MRTLLILFFVASLSLVVTLPVDADTNTLQQDVNALQNVGNSGVYAEAHDHGQVNIAKAGVAQLDTTNPVPFGTHYRTGSVTKTFVAATILLLVGQGKLSLDDTVAHWLPKLPNENGNDWSKITIRELLNHTSGLYDYVQDPNFLATIDTADAYQANYNKTYAPQDLINIALSHHLNFAPGTGWSYSSTNYVVAGQIIQAVTGKTWDAEIDSLISQPLGLTDTFYPGMTITMPDPFAYAYNIYTTSASNRIYTDVTLDNMTWADAGGGLISTTSDENKFMSSLLSGKLLQPNQLTQMETLVPVQKNVGYGLGIVGQQLSCMKQLLWWHNGGTIGYETWTGTTADGTVSLALTLSTSSFTGSDNTFNQTTSNLEDTLIRHVFCGPKTTATDSITQLEPSMNNNSFLQ